MPEVIITVLELCTTFRPPSCPPVALLSSSSP
jgi:hypothetical protein